MRSKTRLQRIEKILQADQLEKLLYISVSSDEWEAFESGDDSGPLEGINYPLKIYVGWSPDEWDESEQD